MESLPEAGSLMISTMRDSVSTIKLVTKGNNMSNAKRFYLTIMGYNLYHMFVVRPLNRRTMVWCGKHQGWLTTRLARSCRRSDKFWGIVLPLAMVGATINLIVSFVKEEEQEASEEAKEEQALSSLHDFGFIRLYRTEG